jgi:hypothetical protein
LQPNPTNHPYVATSKKGEREAYQSSSISAVNSVDGHGGLDVARGGSGGVASHGGSSAGEGRGGADATDGLTREHGGRKRKMYRAGDGGGGRWDRWWGVDRTRS